MSGAGPLYVLAIGAITNVAQAILLEPKIIDKIVVVWLGGQPPHFKSAAEFNLMQDIPASKLMFDSGVPLVLIPCMTVASHLAVTKEELAGRLMGKSKIGAYLGENVTSQFRDDLTWGHDPGRHPLRLCHYVSRDQIFGDLFAKLEQG